MTSTSIWEINSIWFTPPRNNDRGTNIIPYRSWKDFIDCKPYRVGKPYIMTSWAWKNDNFQIVFIFTQQSALDMVYIEFPVKKEEEPAIRLWLKKHTHPIWLI